MQALYSATVTIAAGSAIDTAKNLESLRTSPPDPLQSLQYSVTFNPSQAKIEAMRQTVLPQLVDDSRKLAQSLASAAGVKLGAIRSISDSPGAGGAVFLTWASPHSATATSPQIRVLDPCPAFHSAPPRTCRSTFSINVVFAVTP